MTSGPPPPRKGPLNRPGKAPEGAVHGLRSVPTVAEQPADEQQILGGHDRMTGRSVSQIVNPKLAANRGIRANRPPAKPKHVLLLGMARKHKAIRAPLSRQRVDKRPLRLVERPRAWAGLAVGQIDRIVSGVAPAKIQLLVASSATGHGRNTLFLQAFPPIQAMADAGRKGIGDAASVRAWVRESREVRTGTVEPLHRLPGCHIFLLCQ